jgi:hypothetical protein
MKIAKSGKTVTIDRAELEILVKHVGEFEKLVKTFERLEAAGKLAPDFQRQWTSTRKFLEAEETRISGTEAKSSGTPAKAIERRKKRCCALILRDDNVIVGCRETNTLYVFAWAACVAEALLGDFNSQLSAGSCASVGGCP